MKRLCLLAAFLATAPGWARDNQQGPQAADSAAIRVAAQAPATVPAGAYTLDKAHSSLIFRVNHLGFSSYTRRFTRFDAKLQFDPANLARSCLRRCATAATIRDGSSRSAAPKTIGRTYSSR